MTKLTKEIESVRLDQTHRDILDALEDRGIGYNRSDRIRKSIEEFGKQNGIEVSA